ncbi:FAD-binding and (Fe-S)-binding domain-containing protein [Microlunatus elymi]|uniref:FAD-binding and (Fe-S)-binding domain-containing protein n=1 Tax=Microlunatus elymi TaxID=2596828 RepID=UPI0038995C5F
MRTERPRIEAPETSGVEPAAQDLLAALRRRGLGDVVDSSDLTRALYSSDASLYRVVPQLVAWPRSTDELTEIGWLAAEYGVPITSRGAGTSIAGNAVGTGLILNTSKHLNKIISVDREARTATVQPGIVHAALQRAVTQIGLRFGPDPSSHSRCTIGGMIGNNACGSRALGYGKTSDNLVDLDIATLDGNRLTLTSDSRPSVSPLFGRLDELVHDHLATIRTEFGRFGRQVSGYAMEHLLPEQGFDALKFLAGTEGTLAMITQATVRLVADAPFKIMIALGYPDMAEAADAVTAILPYGPTAAEGLDSRIVDVVRNRQGEGSVPELPRGEGWLLVELTGEDDHDVRSRADRLLADSGCLDGFVVTDPAQAARLWKIREDGAGLASVSLSRPAHAGWEDTAVPPEHLGSYLRRFEELMSSYGVAGLPYGHFGDGCVHIRIDFPLWEDGGSAAYESFVTDAAELVASYGGSMSGEHGDGRHRSALLPKMYSPRALELFGAVKQIFDPRNLLNPGVLVDPQPLQENLRIPEVRTRPMALLEPHFTSEVHRCTGVGKCVASVPAGVANSAAGVMCPSFQATGNEKDSTRGRARVLEEMINGRLISGGWDAPEVHEALDLCLSCKGCRRDCPTGIDMAAYKAEVLDRSYAGKLRPRSHYALGWLPRWGRMITRVPVVAQLANLSLRLPLIGRLLKRAAGIDPRRGLPTFETQLPQIRSRAAIADGPASLLARAEQRRGRPSDRVDHGPVIIWTDSLSSQFAGGPIASAIAVLDRAGYTPYLLPRDACCGLTWITTGQLDGARRQLERALDVLTPYAKAGIPIVGLEPSCLAVWRSDAPELLDDPRVATVANKISTLAELLTSTDGWQPPELSGVELVVQPHCHHTSVIGWQTDAALLKRTGAKITTVAGCCGLAGNFGMEQGHYEVSLKVAEHDLLPAVRAASRDAIVLADGFSCRTQLAELSDRTAISLADLLARSPR